MNALSATVSELEVRPKLTPAHRCLLTSSCPGYGHPVRPYYFNRRCHRFRATGPSGFLKLPTEIKQQILQLCVDDARICLKCTKDGKPVIHRLSGRARGGMRLLGIGNLPLLFVSKWFHFELRSMIYSQVSIMDITGNASEELDIYRKIRFDKLNPNIKNYLREAKLYVRGVDINSPSISNDTIGYWPVFWHHHQLPNLVAYLKKFRSLERLYFTIYINKAPFERKGEIPPDFFRLLLPLKELNLKRIALSIQFPEKDLPFMLRNIEKSFLRWLKKLEKSGGHEKLLQMTQMRIALPNPSSRVLRRFESQKLLDQVEALPADAQSAKILEYCFNAFTAKGSTRPQCVKEWEDGACKVFVDDLTLL